MPAQPYTRRQTLLGVQEPVRDYNGAMPSWQRWFDSFANAADQAGARGKRFAVDFSGFGNGMSQRQTGSAISTPLMTGLSRAIRRR